MYELQPLDIGVKCTPGTISFNFDEIMSRLDERLEEYKGASFTEDTKQTAKKELARLRRFKKDIDAVRTTAKKQFIAPFEEFETQMNQLKKKVDEPITAINDQVTVFETTRKQERRRLIEKLYSSIADDVKELIPFDRVYSSKWENATTTEKQIRADLEAAAERARNATRTLAAMKSDGMAEALLVYRDTQDLSKAVMTINEYERRKAEILKREKERREQDERRRASEAERKRIEAEHLAEEAERRRVEAEYRKAKAEQDALIASMLAPDGFENTPEPAPDAVTMVYTVTATFEEHKDIKRMLDSWAINYERSGE